MNYNYLADFESRAQLKLLPGLPLIIRTNARNFQKVSSESIKPYSEDLGNCFHQTMLKLCMEVGGAVLGYTYNDEIVIVVINHGTPWYDNDVQKIASAVSASTSLYFYQNLLALDIELNLDTIFITSVFALPSIQDVVQFLIYSQINCMQIATHYTCLNAFMDMGMSKDVVEEFLDDMKINEKTDLLKTKANINFDQLPVEFRMGAACYRVPKLINGVKKYKFSINKSLNLFAEETDFISNIIGNGGKHE